MAVTFIPFAFPGIAGVRCAFQVRSPRRAESCDAEPFAGNISLSVGDDPDRAARNRRDLAVACGLDGLADVRQVHGDVTVFEPEAADPGTDPAQEADGMAVSRPGLGLMIKTADCQPILLAHASGRFVAALHVGWRGNRINYPGTGVREFCARYDLDPASVFAVRGPSLGPAAAEFVNFADEWGPEFLPWFDAARRTMDLWRLTRSQLESAGLLPERIFSLDLCTYSLPDALFSFRRDAHCGRQGSVIWIE
jgi:YfiH family protein